MARKVIDIIRRDGLIERGRQVAARLAEGLEGIRLPSGRIEDLRWRGPMLAVELCDDQQAGLTRRGPMQNAKDPGGDPRVLYVTAGVLPPASDHGGTPLRAYGFGLVMQGTMSHSSLLTMFMEVSRASLILKS